MQYCNMRNNEKRIIDMIVHNEPISEDVLERYIKYINKIQTCDNYLFDKHASIIDALPNDDFDKYIEYLSSITHKKH